MNIVSTHFGPLLAAAGDAETLTVLEYDLPEHPLIRVALTVVCLLIVAWVTFLYIRDTALLPRLARVWLLMLRLCVLAAIGLIAMNFRERTHQMSYRQSRVVVVVDTSLSMRFPAIDATSADDEASDEPASQDHTGARSRSEAVVDLIANSPFIDELREHHDVSVYTFDSALSDQPLRVFPSKLGRVPITTTERAVSGSLKTAMNDAGIDWPEALRPQGLETRLGESLLEAIRRVGGQTLSGIIVISDGGANSGVAAESAHAAALASKPTMRLTTLGVGGTARPVNLQVASIQAPSDVHIGDTYELSAFVRGEQMDGRKIRVELLTRAAGTKEPLAPVESTDAYPNPREIQLSEDGVAVEVPFERLPSVAGEIEYVVRAKTAAAIAEISQEDNERRKTINVVERNTGVLLIAGGPMRDYRFVRNMLYRHPQIDVDVWLQTVEPKMSLSVSQESDDLLFDFPRNFPMRPKADEFTADSKRPKEYDVVICFDPDWKRLTPAHVKRMNAWVSTHAGGVVFVAGDVFTPELASAVDELKLILELYPVFLNSYVIDSQFTNSSVQPWPLGLTQAGQNAGFMQLTDDQAADNVNWNRFPGVFRSYPTGGAKAGATVYAHFSDPRTQTEYGQPVLLASQFYGSGRTMYLGSAELWRLRSLGDEYYDRIWTKLIREVGQGRLQQGSSRGMLLLERNQYILGQTVSVRANLLDPQLHELEVNTVPAVVNEPSGKPLIPGPVLRKDENRPGQFVGEFRANVPGSYRIEIAVPDSDEVLRGRVDVALPNLESDNPRQNAKLLTELSRETGGRYMQLDKFRSLFADVEMLNAGGIPSAKSENLTDGAAAKPLEQAKQKLERQLLELFPPQGEEFLVDERLRTLWDRNWVLWLLVGLLSAEWLTRKLLKLA